MQGNPYSTSSDHYQKLKKKLLLIRPWYIIIINVINQILSMDASMREFYERKIQRLELENIELQEKVYCRPGDEFKLKYELLLEKLA